MTKILFALSLLACSSAFAAAPTIQDLTLVSESGISPAALHEKLITPASNGTYPNSITMGNYPNVYTGGSNPYSITAGSLPNALTGGNYPDQYTIGRPITTRARGPVPMPSIGF